VGVKGEAGSEVEDMRTGEAAAGLTSAQLLLKIQLLDEAIAATDGEIASLQADALHGEGAIFGMSVARKEKGGPVLDARGMMFSKVLSVLARCSQKYSLYWLDVLKSTLCMCWTPVA
jgi:hypothetical protein